MKSLEGTVISNPDAPLRGHRVAIRTRQRDAIPGQPGVRCAILDSPVLGATTAGLQVSDVEWDDPQAVAQWVHDTPQPPPRHTRSRSAQPATSATYTG